MGLQALLIPFFAVPSKELVKVSGRAQIKLFFCIDTWSEGSGAGRKLFFFRLFLLSLPR